MVRLLEKITGFELPASNLNSCQDCFNCIFGPIPAVTTAYKPKINFRISVVRKKRVAFIDLTAGIWIVFCHQVMVSGKP